MYFNRQVAEPEDEDADVQSAEEVDKLTDGQTDGQSQGTCH